MKTINLPPDAPTLMESTRAIGYSTETALADIIDNSIAAQSTDVQIFFSPIDKENYIAILDNGCGMDSEEITEAMKYGSRNPQELRDDSDLGRFGLGMKTASLSQCRRLTVVSKKNNQIYGRRWDIDHVLQTGAWSLQVLDEEDFIRIPQIEKLNEWDHGTLVIWEQLDRLSGGGSSTAVDLAQKMDEVRNHLGLVFHRFLVRTGGKRRLRLSINMRPIEPLDPFLKNKSLRPMDDEVLTIHGANVRVRPYILPHISQLTKQDIEVLGGSDSLRANQGFYIYRNERLLSWGSWFRMLPKKELTKLARIQVDIPNSLDDLWRLDIKKSEAVPPREVKENLKEIIRRISAQSIRVFAHRARMETDGKTIQPWRRGETRLNGFVYLINRSYPLVKVIEESCPQVGRKLEQLLVQLESGLPVNAIYNDMVHDEKVNLQTEWDVSKLMPVVHAVLEGMEGRKRKQMLDQLLSSSPFDEFAEEIRNKVMRDWDDGQWKIGYMGSYGKISQMHQAD